MVRPDLPWSSHRLAGGAAGRLRGLSGNGAWVGAAAAAVAKEQVIDILVRAARPRRHVCGHELPNVCPNDYGANHA